MSNTDVCILPCWNCHDLDFVQVYFKCKRLCLQLNFSNVFLKIWMKWHISQFPTVLKMDIFILFANFGLHLLFVHLSTGNLRKKRIKTNWKKIVDNENPWLLDWSHHSSLVDYIVGWALFGKFWTIKKLFKPLIDIYPWITKLVSKWL